MIDGYLRIVNSLLYSTNSIAFRDRFKNKYDNGNESEEHIVIDDDDQSSDGLLDLEEIELELCDIKREKNFFKIMKIIHEKCHEQILPLLKRSYAYNIRNKNTESVYHIRLSNAIVYSCFPEKHYPVLMDKIDLEYLIKGTEEFLKSSDSVICMLMRMLFDEEYYSIEMKNNNNQMNFTNQLLSEEENNEDSKPKHNFKDSHDNSELSFHHDKTFNSYFDNDFEFNFGIDNNLNERLFNHFTWVWMKAAYAIQYLGILKRKEWQKKKPINKKAMYYLINGINYSSEKNISNDDEYITFVLSNNKNISESSSEGK